jgi:NADH-quinone oxidoreductase subunit F
MEKFIDHCCVKCTHSKEKPCKDFVICCVEGPICHSDQSCSDKRRAIIDKVALNDQFVIC